MYQKIVKDYCKYCSNITKIQRNKNYTGHYQAIIWFLAISNFMMLIKIIFT